MRPAHWDGLLTDRNGDTTDEDSDCDERRRGLERRGGIFDEGAGLRVHRRDDEALSQRGHRCSAARKTCCSLEDVEDATKLVALQASACPTMSSTFRTTLRRAGHRPLRLAPTKAALTPNPCIDCNRYLKFEQALRARPHSRLRRTLRPATMRASTQENGLYRLRKASLDESKGPELRALLDMTQERLAQTLYPARRELRKSRGARASRAEPGFYQRGQAGQSGYLLCPGWRLREDHRASHGEKGRTR